METMTFAQVASKFSDEAAAWEYMEEARWHGHPVCPHCGSDDVLFLQPRDGAPRTTRTGTKSYRRVWKCRAKECKRQFSCLVGTIFEGSHIPLRKWLMALYLAVSAKNGVAALELQRDLEITYKSAWHMVHRIRAAMANVANGKMSGIVAADETWIGANPKRMNAKRRANVSRLAHTEKAIVMSIVDMNTGEIRSQVIPDVTTRTVGKVLNANVDRHGSILYTDSGAQYVSVGRQFVKHYTVNHVQGEYVNHESGATTNRVEGYFGQLKRSIDGTHHGVSDEHLRYAKEFDFRYSTRRMADGERAMAVMNRAPGARLTYESLISQGPFAMGKWALPPGRPGPRKAKPQPLRPA